MAQVATKRIYECDGHTQEGHELAEAHPVISIGRQSLIDNQGIAIVIPLYSTRPSYSVHWAVEIEDTNAARTCATSSQSTLQKSENPWAPPGTVEIDAIREGLTRELHYENHECATALGQEVLPGSLWSASIPNARGLSYEGDLLILTSNRHTRLATASPCPSSGPCKSD